MADNEKLKIIQDKCQIILGNLLQQEGNKCCVDCDAKCPRWASWNLGIFLCIRCAGMHRNLGVHISKVKSVNLDTWTAEQVACLQQMGNSQGRAVYEANLPESFQRPQAVSSLEKFIRDKYEHRKYIAKEKVPPPPTKPAFVIQDKKLKEKEGKNNKAATGIKVGLPKFALPRPLDPSVPISPSVKPVQQQTSKPAEQQVPVSIDLLSLGDPAAGDDIFDVFQSAPTTSFPENSATFTASTFANNTASNLSPEEVDFFNQKSAGATNESKNMTSIESIMSLYTLNTGQMPTQQQISPVYGQVPAPQNIAPVYVIPGELNVLQSAYGQVPIPGYPAMPNYGIHPTTHKTTPPDHK